MNSCENWARQSRFWIIVNYCSSLLLFVAFRVCGIHRQHLYCLGTSFSYCSQCYEEKPQCDRHRDDVNCEHHWVTVTKQGWRSEARMRDVELGSELKEMKYPHLSVKMQHALVFVDLTQKRGSADVTWTEELMAAADTLTWTEGPLPREGAGLCQNVAPFICKGRRWPEAGGVGSSLLFYFPFEE